MKCAVLVFLVAGAPLVAQARPPHALFASQRTSAILIEGDRVVFGDLSPTAPRAYLDLDIAPAPSPGRSAVITRDAVRSALRRAGADEALADGLSAQHTVTRRASELTEPQLRREVIASLSNQLPLGVSIGEILGLKSVHIPMGEVRVEARMGMLRRSTRASITIHVNDRIVARQSATVNLQGDAKTPTLRSNLPRGAMVTEDDVELAPAELERLPSGTVTRPSDLVGKRLTQPATAGRPIQERALEVPPTIERGTSVRVVLISHGLRITRSAVAQENGNVGDTIRLKAGDGDDLMRGRVHSASEVRVSFGGTP